MQKIHIRMKNRLRPKMHGPVVKNKREGQERPSQDGRGRRGADAFRHLLLVCVVFSRSCRNSGSWIEGSGLCTRKLRLREGRNSSQVTRLVSD